MLIYRLISWILIAAIGWGGFFFMFRTEKDGDPAHVDTVVQFGGSRVADFPATRGADPVAGLRGRRAHPGAGDRRQVPPGLRTRADRRPEPGRDHDIAGRCRRR